MTPLNDNLKTLPQQADSPRRPFSGVTAGVFLCACLLLAGCGALPGNPGSAREVCGQYLTQEAVEILLVLAESDRDAGVTKRYALREFAENCSDFRCLSCGTAIVEEVWR